MGDICKILIQNDCHFITHSTTISRYVYASTGEIVSPDLQQQLWIKGQPNNLGEVDAENGEDCVEFRTSWFPHHHWNDATCSDEIESICEMWFSYIKINSFAKCQFPNKSHLKKCNICFEILIRPNKYDAPCSDEVESICNMWFHITIYFTKCTCHIFTVCANSSENGQSCF